MNIFNKLITTTFDKVYMSIQPDKVCNLIQRPDLFDGLEYSIDEFYEYAKQFFDKPCDFYKTSNSDYSIRLIKDLHPNEKPTHNNYKRLIFESPIRTEWSENNTVPFKWFTKDGELSDYIVLFVPGWGRNSQSIEENMSNYFRNLGIDVGLLTKPYHQARTPDKSISGEYFISSNIFWTIMNFRQLVVEIRYLIQYMKERYKYVGLFGMSSGGFQTSLAANCEEVDFLLLFMTGCRVGSITWHGSLTKEIVKELIKRKITEEMLVKIWSISDEEILGHNCRAKNIKHYITLYDTVIPTKYQYLLWEKLGKNSKREIPGGHYSGALMYRRVIKDAVDFILEI